MFWAAEAAANSARVTTLLARDAPFVFWGAPVADRARVRKNSTSARPPIPPEKEAPMLAVGDKAPTFELARDGGATVSSKDLQGKPYVLYFYPKDNTPGCTQESCDFRDNFARITAKGVDVFGVSRDSVKSHDNFKAKYELPFVLLSDPDKTLHAAYGAWGLKKMYGKEVEGTIRSTFLVDAKGKIVAAWPKVSVKGHVDQVLAEIDKL